jgi:hypothetical protein
MQKNLPLRGGRKRGLTLLTVAVLVVLGGIALWMLSARNVLPESWWAAVGATFTVVGVILASLQVQPPAFLRSEDIGQASSPTSVSSRRKGTLVIRAGKQLCGSTVELCGGFEVTSERADFAANIVERRTGGVVEYVGVFPSVVPGNYTARLDGNTLAARVTVSSGRTAEIDWRHVHGTTNQ